MRLYTSKYQIVKWQHSGMNISPLNLFRSLLLMHMLVVLFRPSCSLRLQLKLGSLRAVMAKYFTSLNVGLKELS